MNNGWIRLCMLLDDDVELRTAVQSAVDSAEDVDPWLVMIDGLDDAGALAYLDQKDSGAQLVDALAGLPRILAAGVDLDLVGDVEADLPTVVTVANELLAVHGLALVYLEEEPDAFPLVAVSAADAEQVVALVSELGHTARTYP